MAIKSLHELRSVIYKSSLKSIEVSEEEWFSLREEMEEILKNTYGVPLVQGNEKRRPFIAFGALIFIEGV